MIPTFKISVLATVAALGLATAASAATTLTWEAYDKSELGTAKADRAALEGPLGFGSALEDFEGFTPIATGNTDPNADDKTPLQTSVGLFTTDAGSKCGGSCDAPEDESLIRNESRWGRYDTTGGDAENWLDSNDNDAIILDADIGRAFDFISFFLTDIDDVGAVTFNIDVDGHVFDIAQNEFGGKKQGNADLFYVKIDFDAPVFASKIKLNIDDGDGFGIDDVHVSAVPIPASFLLLGAAMGGLGMMRRKQKS